MEDYFSQETDRLYFRKLTERDIDSWVEFFHDNPCLPYLGIDLNKSNEVIAKEWITIQIERYKNNQFGHLAAIEKSTGHFIGMAGILTRQIDDELLFEIAYSLKPKFWGKGYGTEMAQQIRKFGEMNKLASKFISIIDKNNIRSIKVAEKNGMHINKETSYLGMEVFIFSTNSKL